MNADSSHPGDVPSQPVVPLDYEPVAEQHKRWTVRPYLMRIALVIAVLILAWSLWRRMVPPPRLDLRCMMNLRQLAVAAHAYADNNAGAFPDSLDTLLAAGYFGQNPATVAPICVCP